MKIFRGRFRRPDPTRSYRKIFHVFMEGTKTEPLYFEIFRSYSNVSIKPYPSNKKNSAKQIFNRVKKFISREKPIKSDELWIMVDIDNNKKEDLHDIKEWCKKKHGRALAVSNPKFEYWLLLHFDKGDDLRGAESVVKRLEKYLPSFSKSNLDLPKLQLAIPTAILHAKAKISQCEDWYTDYHTTVFQLVEKIEEAEK